MRFEYDPEKSRSNQTKHGLSFEQTKLLWQSPFIEIEAKVVDEPRYMIIGQIKGKCYSCIYTLRSGVIRLISARRSRKSEEKLYYEHIKK